MTISASPEFIIDEIKITPMNLKVGPNENSDAIVIDADKGPSPFNEPTFIPMDKCIHRGFYKIYARNFDYGVYDEDKKCFYGIRFKFGETYIFPEYHWDTGAPHGTVQPLEFLKMCPLSWIFDDQELEDWIYEEIKGVE